LLAETKKQKKRRNKKKKRQEEVGSQKDSANGYAPPRDLTEFTPLKDNLPQE